MCFSAEASFTVGTLLSAVGIATLKRVKKPQLFLIALFPLLFGIQQFLEGMVWLSMHPHFIPTLFNRTMVNFYLFFAWMFWPVFVPAAFFTAEEKKWKRKVFAAAFLIGLAIAAADTVYLIRHPVIPTISGNSLNYGFSPLYGNLIYGLVVFTPIFFSSIPRMEQFGIGLLVSFVISQIIYTYAFTSVWCFFCAIVSILLYRILSKADTQQKPAEKIYK